MSTVLSLTLLAYLASYSVSHVSAASEVIYDDTNPAWVYTPQDAWGAISLANPCPSCTAQPDATKAHNETWHDLSKGGSAQLSFTGTSLTVYAICPAKVYRSNFTFTLDGDDAGQFLAPEGGCSTYTYNQSIFSKTDLKNDAHTFTVTNWIAPGDEFSTSDLLLDYAVVEAAGGSSTGSSSSSSTGTTTTSGSGSVTTTSTSSTSTSTGSTQNRTVDDTDPSWTYEGPWGVISAAAPCTVCATQPNATKVYDSTWHDLSQAGNATLSFSGTGLNVYTICPGPLANGGAFSSDFAFTLDGVANGTFVGPPAGCKEYEYNQLVYNISGLVAGTHTFVINNVIASSGNTSDLLLDYAVVFGASSSASSASSTDTSGATTTITGSGGSTSTPGSGAERLASPLAAVILGLASTVAAFSLC